MSTLEKLSCHDVNQQFAWDLTAIFANYSEFEATVTLLNTQIARFSKSVSPNFIKTANHFFDGLQQYYALQKQLDIVDTYADLYVSENKKNAQALNAQQLSNRLVDEFQSRTAFVQNDINVLSDDKLYLFYKEIPELQQYQKDLTKQRLERPYRLSLDNEQLLNSFGSVLNNIDDIYVASTNADLHFGTIIDDNDNEIELTHGNAAAFSTSPNRNIREAAYEKIIEAHRSVQHTAAATLQKHVQTQNTISKVKKYPSTRFRQLHSNQIPESVYDAVVNSAKEHVDIYRAYYNIVQRAQKYDVLYKYDRFVELAENPKTLDYDYATAQKVVTDALSILGREYVAHLQDAFTNRWIDVLETSGKVSGGFATYSPDSHPYILLNWSDTFSSTETLAHELGHALHSVYSAQSQIHPFNYADIFTAEIASTVNEELLHYYLLSKHSENKDLQINLLQKNILSAFSMLFGTTLDADFEHLIYQSEASGTTLTTDFLNEQFLLLQKAYGADVFADVETSKTGWISIPHFYYNFYLYQYATAYAVAKKVAHDIHTHQPNALENYLNFLKAGSSQFPVDTVKNHLKIDMTTSDYLADAFAAVQAEIETLETYF